MFSQINVLNYTHNNNLCHCIIRGKCTGEKELKTLCRGTYNFKKNIFVIKHVNLSGRTEAGFRGIMKALEKHDWSDRVIGIEGAKHHVASLLKSYNEQQNGE